MKCTISFCLCILNMRPESFAGVIVDWINSIFHTCSCIYWENGFNQHFLYHNIIPRERLLEPLIQAFEKFELQTLILKVYPPMLALTQGEEGWAIIFCVIVVTVSCWITSCQSLEQRTLREIWWDNRLLSLAKATVEAALPGQRLCCAYLQKRTPSMCVQWRAA